ncbi:MAG: hypothetical protein JF593_11480 [Novosphingobium sp.]|nr:hypothetical protein [Novosphingobium sp.]
MISYSFLNGSVQSMPPTSPQWATIVPLLVNAWLDDYAARPGSDIVETQADNFSYLFDIAAERLIAAWGVSRGRNAHERDAARMRGHPLSAGQLYHRGHAVPHTLGGGTDINLVPQLGRVNIGPFRPLEKRAVATPGSLYFTYWSYRGSRGAGQVPTGVDQGLLIAGQLPAVQRHGN